MNDPERIYNLTPPNPVPRSSVIRAMGIDRWNQAADNEAIYTFRSAMSGAERNDATPIALLYFQHSS